MAKKYCLPRDQLKTLALGFGSCIASDRITVDGQLVGYMYRETPDQDVDSGWRFFEGDEDRDYADNADNFALYDVNTIANYDPAITDHLDAPAGTAFERDEAGAFIEVPFEPVED